MADEDARFGSRQHADGRAHDTPGHLAALTGADPQAKAAAVHHLWASVLHQGVPYPVTPLVAEAVAAIVGGARLAADASLRVELLRFLTAVIDAAQPWIEESELAAMADPPGRQLDDATIAAWFWDRDPGDDDPDDEIPNALYARSVLACRAVVATVLAAVEPLLDDAGTDAAVRAAAALTVCAGATVPGSTVDRSLLRRRLHAVAAAAAPDDRAAVVLAAGRLGFAPLSYLDDPHPGVRACAALAPALADEPAATAELLAALDDPPATEHWFVRPPPQLDGHIRFLLVEAAVARVDDPERLLPAALALAPTAGVYTAGRDWGPLLQAIFATRSGGPLTDAQRRYLGALVDNGNLWDPRNDGLGAVFRLAGLPHDRETCRTLAADLHPDQLPLW